MEILKQKLVIVQKCYDVIHFFYEKNLIRNLKLSFPKIKKNKFWILRKMSPAPMVLNFGFGSQTTVLNFGLGSRTTVFIFGLGSPTTVLNFGFGSRTTALNFRLDSRTIVVTSSRSESSNISLVILDNILFYSLFEKLEKRGPTDRLIDRPTGPTY